MCSGSSVVKLGNEEWELWFITIPSDGGVGDGSNVPRNRLDDRE